MFDEEKTEVRIEVSATVVCWVSFLLINWFLLLYLLSRQIDWGMVVMVGIDIFNIAYFYIAASKVKKLFEEILL